MGLIVVISNYLVQFPIQYLGLSEILTYGAFTYPITFLVTDLANRAYGKIVARKVVYVGFVIGIDKDNELVRIQTKTGPVSLKVTEHSNLLFPGLHEGPAFDLDPDKFEGQVKGKMVRISSREGKVDHIAPIRP